MFPKIVGFSSKSSILIGVFIIFTIHFGGFPPIFGITHLMVQLTGCFTPEFNPLNFFGGELLKVGG